MDFYNKTGKMAIGSRLRRLSEAITDQAAEVYRLYGVDLRPKWFPVFFALSDGKAKGIMEIAREIGHSHPSVSKIVQEMMREGLLIEQPTDDDARKTVVMLAPAGLDIREKIQLQYRDVNSAIERTLGETSHNLWKAIEEWEYILEQKNLLERVKDERKNRESAGVTIVPFTDEYKTAFRELNERWIKAYFKMEESDYKVLDHPRENITDHGGFIFMALYNGKPVGTCALLRMEDNVYELAKMAVAPEAQGKNIGWMLGQACIAKGKELKADKLYLESNTRLTPAINLYHKLGFKKVTGHPSPYERCNIQMELVL